MPLLQATRETFWTISSTGKVVFYLLAAVAICVFFYGCYLRISRISRGQDDWFERTKDIPNRIRTAVYLVVSNAQLFDRDFYAGVMHTFIFWGFLTLTIATAILGVDMDIYRPLTGRSFWVGDFYLTYQFMVDLFGLLFVVGVGMALYRRYFVHGTRLESDHATLEDDLFILALLLLGIGGFLAEAVAIVGQPQRADEVVSFVGWFLASGLQLFGLTPAIAKSIYPVLWWQHSLLALVFIAWIPFAKPFHMISGFANVVTRDEKAGKRLPGTPADIDADTGAESIDHFSWRELLDLDACTKCGRCSSVCPANASGRPLDPREVILDLKGYRDALDADETAEQPIVADGEASVIDAATMESCMACLACMDACPVEIEHLKTFTRLQRQLTDQGDVDRNLQDVFQNLMQKGNTFGDAQRNRGEWATELEFDVTDAREDQVEYLWYVGDYPSYDDRNKEVARSLAKLFEHADVEFGILFDDEKYDGNDIRRLGEELLYVELAGHHVESFQECDFEKIVCTDPHSYNTFKNEYPEIEFENFADDPMMPFDIDSRWNENGEVEILHWTQVVEELVQDDRLGLKGTELDYTVTYHDPCHLGRYNDEYEAPRALIRATGCDLHEMERNRENSFCCGGGGGGLWMEAEQETKPSEDRLQEALERTTPGSAIEKFVVACPMCLTMYEDGRKTGGFEDEIEIVDIAELLIEAVESTTDSPVGEDSPVDATDSSPATAD